MSTPMTPAAQELIAHLEAEQERCQRAIDQTPPTDSIKRSVYVGWRDAYDAALRQVRAAVPRIEEEVSDKAFMDFQEHYG
jgi:hypothetical protein